MFVRICSIFFIALTLFFVLTSEKFLNEDQSPKKDIIDMFKVTREWSGQSQKFDRNIHYPDVMFCDHMTAVCTNKD